ncbi:unnamed protein product [Protopolystoma xenopodis]|uniref:Uncharacterized protein n=1 Tax=Protopolystoma xenopodis TaxID=117903 RepID=A0A3S5A0B8_9PLAT|nr:unnamed protein product [Protopolystoma xenopodis]
MLPCPLRLPRDAANPAFSPSDQALPAGINQCNSHGHAHLEQAIGLSHFRPIASAIGGGPGVVLAGAGRQLSTALTTNDGLFGVIPDALAMTFASTNVEEEDDDYHRLSDFSSIMADLQLHSRGPPRRLPSTKGSLQFVPANNENR